MPTIFIKNGFRFFFYSADWNEPMHVHVEYQDAKAKFWINPVGLASSYRMKEQELKRAKVMVEEHLELIREKWNEYFRNKNE